jgi:hypothetical protein
VAMKLDEVERNQSYPLNENDAFMLSGALYFDRDALEWYRGNTRRRSSSGQFVQAACASSHWMNLATASSRCSSARCPAASTASPWTRPPARGTDYTSMGVIDLETGALCAELHAKIDSARAVIQAHALGKWYNTAKIMVERQGGYGEALITVFATAPPGSRSTRTSTGTSSTARARSRSRRSTGCRWGTKTRPGSSPGLADWIRKRLFPWLSTGIVGRAGHLRHATTNPSPRAQDGTNDDRVMMLGMLVDLYRQFGRAHQEEAAPQAREYEPHPSRRRN